MQFTQKLLSFIHRVFDKDPRQFLALRLSYTGGSMSWSIKDAVLTTSVMGGAGQNLSVDLTLYTVDSLAAFLGGQVGYSVLYETSDPDQMSLGARVLIDGGASIATSNGDHIYGYTSPLWAFLEACASELARAQAALVEMVKQLATTTAGDMWLDEIGGYYGIPRLTGEADAQYGPRIVAEVLRPRANNVAIEIAIQQFTGQTATVSDVVQWTGPLPKYNGAITYNGGSLHNSTAQPIYGLFDVVYGYDLLGGGDIASFQAVVSGMIGRLRDAGTQLRSVSLSGSALFETVPGVPDDSSDMPLTVGAPLADTASAGTEAMLTDTQLATMDEPNALAASTDGTSATFTFLHVYNGGRTHNAEILYRGHWQFTGATVENEYAGSAAMV